jgi:hypothetical protein
MSVQEDRRDVKSQRIPFEAIVEVGDVDPGAAFEAQGVNLSASGMQLRTAYLPEVGQSLLCRFGSGAQEIQAEADVVWTKHGARGGEFGIRFTNVDGASAAALWDLCGVQRESSEDGSDATRTDADEGTRVRLHIDGLTSPMKARVRGAVGKELLVGSNLEFLKVGRALELENVDQGGKRPAHIDRVDVELDKESRVPQLVVTLRYDDMSADPPPVVPFPTPPPPYHPPSQSPSVSVSSSQPIAEPTPEEPPPPRAAVPAAPPAMASAPPTPPPARSAVASVTDDRTPEEIELARMMRSKASIVAADAMVKMAALGVRAKAALGEALSNALQRSRERHAVAAPRRKTSPPPGGALHATGKRVVRDGADGPEATREADENRVKRSRRNMIAAGGATGLVAISVIAMLSRGSSAPPGAEKSADPNATAPAAQTTVQASELPPNASGPVEAKVPLFGPTMVATAESPAAAAPAIVPGQPMSPINRTLAFGGSPTIGAEGMDHKLDAERRDGEDKSGKAHGKPAPFGHGKVEHAMVLRIKTDGAISDLRGVRSSGGFTLTMPGRRTIDSGSALAARDPRIASVRVANNAKGSELTFQFKGGVPPYLVSPNGHDLQLSLGRPDTSRDAKDVAHRTATAQKRVDPSHRAPKR